MGFIADCQLPIADWLEPFLMLKIFQAKARSRKGNPLKRGSALRLCVFA